MKKIKFTLKIASIIIAMLFVGLFVSAKWNQLWLYDGWPGAWGSPKWLVESDGETSYDMEFVLMLIWVYGIMLSAVSIILYFKHKNKKLGENNDQIIDDQIDNQEINLAESISRTDEKGRKSGYKQLIMEITNRLSKIRK